MLLLPLLSCYLMFSPVFIVPSGYCLPVMVPPTAVMLFACIISIISLSCSFFHILSYIYIYLYIYNSVCYCLFIADLSFVHLLLLSLNSKRKRRIRSKKKCETSASPTTTTTAAAVVNKIII